MPKRVAILVASGFELAEFEAMREILEQAGIAVPVVSAKKHEVRGWDNTDWADSVPVEVAVLDASPADWDAVMIPGGLIAADTLRADQHAVRLVRDALDHGIPVAAIGHAPWVLSEAGALRGRRVTSHPAIRTDLENAGAHWLDEAAVVDGGVITGRHRHDLPDLLARLMHAIGPDRVGP
ncbi:MAG: DJ-1/PfpI family protein [Alphaproteobacteria bacterium]|nr:DJ-1/PfpI family protein [Alphaproteobacteria bacterium]